MAKSESPPNKYHTIQNHGARIGYGILLLDSHYVHMLERDGGSQRIKKKLVRSNC